jgi:hypothetical protein
MTAKEKVLAVYPTAQCMWTSKGWRVFYIADNGKVVDIGRTDSARVPEAEAWADAASKLGEMRGEPHPAETSEEGEKLLSEVLASVPEAAPLDPNKGFVWMCICGVKAMPLDDDTHCDCGDLYLELWRRVPESTTLEERRAMESTPEAEGGPEDAPRPCYHSRKLLLQRCADCGVELDSGGVPLQTPLSDIEREELNRWRSKYGSAEIAHGQKVAARIESRWQESRDKGVCPHCEGHKKLRTSIPGIYRPRYVDCRNCLGTGLYFTEQNPEPASPALPETNLPPLDASKEERAWAVSMAKTIFEMTHAGVRLDTTESWVLHVYARERQLRESMQRAQNALTEARREKERADKAEKGVEYWSNCAGLGGVPMHWDGEQFTEAITVCTADPNDHHDIYGAAHKQPDGRMFCELHGHRALINEQRKQIARLESELRTLREGK